MKPGIELDTLIAEKVTGAAEVEVCFVQQLDQEAGIIATGTEFRPLPYSTDIAAAWEVVEKLKLAVIPSGTGWAAGPRDKINPQYWDHANMVGPPWAWEESAPHAICLAALKAVGAIE